MINVSVLIATLNEEARLGSCLFALQQFNEIIVIDSGSVDGTVPLAQSMGVQVEHFQWNGAYPKKRQWALKNLNIKHDFVFFVDADEIVIPELVAEIKELDFSAAGYFIKGQYVWGNRVLKQGLKNNKLALFNRYKIEFPVIDDLDIEGMGEIEGHYQPVLKSTFSGETILQLKSPLIHDAYAGWAARHQRYAVWEAAMIKRHAYPKDPLAWREFLKQCFRWMPMRGLMAFIHCYVLNRGFLDGAAGFDFAMSRMKYYQMVSAALKTNKVLEKTGAVDRARFAK